MTAENLAEVEEESGMPGTENDEDAAETGSDASASGDTPTETP